jgi:hypothetical protein
MSLDMKVESSGPLFDGRAARDLDDTLDAWKKNLATVGAASLRQDMNATFRVQTPYYRLQVVAAPQSPDWKITDGGVIYGPWLEGIGSRNSPVTRFPGYGLFRKAVQKLGARADAIGQPIVAKFVARMNG